MKTLSVTIQMKATEQYFPVVLFIMLYKVVLTFESVDAVKPISVAFQIGKPLSNILLFIM